MKNTFSFILGIIVVLLLAVGGYMYFGGQDDISAPAEENAAVEQEMPGGNSPETPEMISVPGGSENVSSDSSNSSKPSGSEQKGDATMETAKQPTVVTYTGDGFSPSSVTIKVGDVVKFVNGSSLAMWVASAPHPSHTNYPEFDQKTAVDKGMSYEFTFTKAGTWKYHNHRSASDSGTVIVK